MENINRYIAIGWFNDKDVTNLRCNKYIIFDSLTYEVKIVSDNALKLINNQLLNIDYDDYCNHLTPIKRFRTAGTLLNPKNIEVHYEIKKESGQLYTEVKIDNISNSGEADNLNIEKYSIVDNTMDDLMVLYGGFIIIGEFSSKHNQYIMKIMKKIGYDKDTRQLNSDSFLFKRGFKRTNLNIDVNQQLRQRENKLKVLGKDIIDYEYIEDNGIWLINTDLSQSDITQIPRCMDYISYNFTNIILKELSKTKRKLVVYVTESQLESIKYNIGIMPEECKFGKKVIPKTEIVRQFNSAIDNNRLVVRLKQ